MKVLEVRNLSKQYDNTSGIFNLDLNIEYGDIVLLLGPNGAGKTTAFRGMLGLTKVEYDKIEVLDNDMDKNQLECLRNIGAMVSKPVFYEYLTGYENLKLLESVYDNVDIDRINEVFNIVGLTDAKNKVVSSYSSGMKQRLDLARAIVHQPKLLILDEPFNGMDIEAKFKLKRNLKLMQDQNNLGIIISSHMVGDLESFANKAIIIYEGKTLFSGYMDDINKSGLTLEEFYLEKLNLYKSNQNKEV